MEIKTPALFVTIVTVLRKSKMVDEFRWNFRKFERTHSYTRTDNGKTLLQRWIVIFGSSFMQRRKRTTSLRCLRLITSWRRKGNHLTTKLTQSRRTFLFCAPKQHFRYVFFIYVIYLNSMDMCCVSPELPRPVHVDVIELSCISEFLNAYLMGLIIINKLFIN